MSARELVRVPGYGLVESMTPAEAAAMLRDLRARVAAAVTPEARCEAADAALWWVYSRRPLAFLDRADAAACVEAVALAKDVVAGNHHVFSKLPASVGMVLLADVRDLAMVYHPDPRRGWKLPEGVPVPEPAAPVEGLMAYQVRVERSAREAAAEQDAALRSWQRRRYP